MPLERLKPLQSRLSVAFIAIILIAGIGDIVDDLKQGSSAFHIGQEVVIVLLGLYLLYRFSSEVRRQRNVSRQLQSEVEVLTEKHQQATEALKSARRAFAEAVSQQFLDWQLSESETEVAWLLLKGYNSKEIAQLRELSDKTVRNQFSSIYKKSGLKGKQAFIAWFMEDLL